MRIVCDTNTLISALLFKGHTSYLVDLWKSHKIVTLACDETIDEFVKVLHYPKFKLSSSQIKTLIDYYVPYIEKIVMDKNFCLTIFHNAVTQKTRYFLN